MYEGFTRVPLASYKYSEAWASLRGIDRGHSARGVIAQELHHVDSLGVHVGVSNYEDGAFSLDQMFKVDKQGLVLDLIGALQAKHVCYTSSCSDGSLTARTATSWASGTADLKTGISSEGNSGSVYMITGSARASGACVLNTGHAYRVNNLVCSSGMGTSGLGGRVCFAAGGGKYHGAAALAFAGVGSLVGGTARIEAGGGTGGGSLCCGSPATGCVTIGHDATGSAPYGGTTVAYADDEFRAVAGEESGAFLQTRRSNVGSGRIDLVSRGGGLLELSSSSSDYAVPPTMLCSGDGSAASGVLLRTGTGGTGSAAGDAQINGGRGGGTICMRSGNGFENGGQIELETGAGSEIGAPAALTTAGVSRDKSGDILVVTEATVADTGAIRVSTGSAASLSGNIRASAGHATGKGGGNVRLSLAAHTGANGGSASLFGGEGTHRGGGIHLCGGQGSLKAGNITLIAGLSLMSSGGAVRIATGDAAQAAGPLVMVAGSGGEYGGRIELLGGSSAYGPGASACAQSGKGTTKSGRMSAVTSKSTYTSGSASCQSGCAVVGSSGMIKLGIGCAQIVGDAGLGCGSSSGGITGGNTNIYAGGAAAAAGLLRVTAGTADIGGRVGLLAGNGQLSRGGVLHLSAATGETVSGPIGISSGRSAIGSTGALNIKTRSTLTRGSGAVHFKAAAANGMTGTIRISSGDVYAGSGSGNVSLKAGSSCGPDMRPGSVGLYSGAAASTGGSCVFSSGNGAISGDMNIGADAVHSPPTSFGVSRGVTCRAGKSASVGGALCLVSGSAKISGVKGGTTMIVGGTQTGQGLALGGGIVMGAGQGTLGVSGQFGVRSSTAEASGNIMTSTGAAPSVGKLDMSSGAGASGRGGQTCISVGTSMLNDGGSVGLESSQAEICQLSTESTGTSARLFAGMGMDNGGKLDLVSGRGTGVPGSGELIVRTRAQTANSHRANIHMRTAATPTNDGGCLGIYTGHRIGSSGGISCVTGQSSNGCMGDIVLFSGPSKISSGPLIAAAGHNPSLGDDMATARAGMLLARTGSGTRGGDGQITAGNTVAKPMSNTFNAGSSTSGLGGQAQLSGGETASSHGGQLELAAGAGLATGGGLVMTAGAASGDGHGGGIQMIAGAGTAHSGNFALRTSRALCSGEIDLMTGTAFGGASGRLAILTGAGRAGRGGSVVLSSGLAVDTGGAVVTCAGQAQKGGGSAVALAGGALGRGDGGSISLLAGSSARVGGATCVRTGGAMANGHGRGRILMTSATGIGEAESGRCLLRSGATEGSGEASGAVSFRTGHGDRGPGFRASSGWGLNGGCLGFDSGEGDIGGKLGLAAGKGCSGGAVFVRSGQAAGDSGDLSAMGGSATRDQSGRMLVSAGHSTQGSGATATLRAGKGGGCHRLYAGASTDSTAGNFVIGTGPGGSAALSTAANVASGHAFVSTGDCSVGGNSGVGTFSTGAAQRAGRIYLCSGTSGHLAGGGSISLTGMSNAHTAIGSAILLLGGDQSNYHGGSSNISAGKCGQDGDGHVVLSTGGGDNAWSGCAAIRSPAAGFCGGGTGNCAIQTGEAKQGSSGSAVLGTGCPLLGASGALCLAAGCARDSSGNVTIEGGSAMSGGDLQLSAGCGTIGGRVRISGRGGGSAPGCQVGCQAGSASDLGGGALVHAGMAGDLGGSSSLSAGLSSCANGGTVSLVSGVGGRQVSGVVTIVSGESERGNSGSLGVAALVGGAITLETSAASDVGHITMSARKSACARAGGVGVRRSPSGGNEAKGCIVANAGDTTEMQAPSGTFFLRAGQSTCTSACLGDGGACGGCVMMAGGKGTFRGGSTLFASGAGRADAASGSISFKAAAASGNSGAAELTSGSADLSDTLSGASSGSARLGTGGPADGRGGTTFVTAGSGGGSIEIGSSSVASRRGHPGDAIALAGYGARGGMARIKAGNGYKGPGGIATFAAGHSDEGNGANASLAAGATRGNAAGIVILEAGAALSTASASPSTIGGAARVTGGIATIAIGGNLGAKGGDGDKSGAVLLSSNVVEGEGTSGMLRFGSGTSSNGNSGVVNLRSGDGEGATGGRLTLSVGTARGGSAGDLCVAAGDTSARTRASGGEIALCCPSGGDRDEGGALTLVGGPGYPGGDVLSPAPCFHLESESCGVIN